MTFSCSAVSIRMAQRDVSDTYYCNHCGKRFQFEYVITGMRRPVGESTTTF